ncbi:MAG TPA: queuosine salvage family protein, partial [Acidimicrobiales bacterium]|nr:queuosine salvage family protein [Acidimicrobiales bacterium]
PHTLRMLDVLVYDDVTAERIASSDLFVPGEPAEVEIRANGLWAIELLVQRLNEDTDREPVDAATVDHHLWQLGQSPEIKAVRRHRCRCPWY